MTTRTSGAAGRNALVSRCVLERFAPEQKKRILDNGPEFLPTTFVARADEAGMLIRYIQPGKPNQNAYIERYTGKLTRVE